MNSIARHIDGFTIAQQLRQERKLHRGSFLLLEGLTDIKRFEKFADDIECSLTNCFNKENALQAAILLSDEGFPGVVAVVDADFDRIKGANMHHENIIYSEGHDLDIDWATERVFNRYFSEVSDIEKVKSAGGAIVIWRGIFDMIKPISCAKFLNSNGAIPLRLSGIDFGECIKWPNLSIDVYISSVYAARQFNNFDRTAFKELVVRQDNVEMDIFQMTNGHDFHEAVGYLLRSQFGNRAGPQTWGREVGSHIRMIFDDNDFCSSGVYREIKDWETNNYPYLILDRRLSS